jgi:RNA polymerase sigma-70 factor (sigma-E family)
MDWLSEGVARRQFESFAAGASDGLVRTAYLMTGDLAETEDLVQETLLRVARRWRRVHAMDHPAAYARRILVNLVIDGQQRRRRRVDELDSGDDAGHGLADESAAGALRAIDARSEFHLALATLPPRQRAVVVLRYWEDLPEAQVAELLGCSVGTVKSSASRGVVQLRRALAPGRPRSEEPGISTTNERRSSP